MHLIDWPIYKRAHRGLSSEQKTTMIKFRTHWIATRARLVLLKESPTALCPCCHQHDETWEHILRCPNQVGAQAELFHSLQKWMREKHTPLKLHLLIISNLRNALGLAPSSAFTVEGASDSLQRFQGQQHDIGWLNLFCGFVSTSLKSYIESQLPSDLDKSGEDWVIGLLRHLQRWVTNTWIRRCKLEHNKHREEQSATRQQLLHRITEVYQLRHRVPSTFGKCFDFPIHKFENKSDNFLFNWLDLHEKVIKTAASNPIQQSRILDFFPPAGNSRRTVGH